MAQKKENYRASGKYIYAWPANSTAVNSGDLVELDPQTGRIKPLTLSEEGAHRFVGVCDDKWTSNDCIYRYGVGTTAYTLPATTTGVDKLKVQTQGMFDLAISDTSGYVGQTVYLATATSGGQVFTITQPDTDSTTTPIGKLAEDFSGATANDVQKVIIFPQLDNLNSAMLWYLKNHVVTGMFTAWDGTSHISYTKGVVMVDGKSYSFPAGVNTLVHICAAKASQRRVILYGVNESGADVCVDTATVLFTASAATATALQDSQFWPSTSFVIFAAAYLGSNSTDLNAGAVKNVRRSVTDIAFRRFIN